MHTQSPDALATYFLLLSRLVIIENRLESKPGILLVKESRVACGSVSWVFVVVLGCGI